MEDYRQLGRSGLRVSGLAFGTMSFGGDADADESERMYRRCREAGINLFDCANVYNGGESERLLGRFAAHERDEVVLTSKVYFPTGSGPNDRGLSRYHVVREVERSLRRLGTDRLDILFLHRWDDAVPLDETLRAVDDLVRAGKVLYLGVSNFAAWQTMKAISVATTLGAASVVCVQPMYNLVKRQAEVEILPLARHEGLGVVPYSPLGGGLLAGKYGVGRAPAAGRLTSNRMYMTRYGEPEYLAVADGMRAIAEELGVHPAALAVAWVGSHPDVSAPLIGARNVRQLEDVLGARAIAIDDALRVRIAALTPEPPPATDRSEERTPETYERTLARSR